MSTSKNPFATTSTTARLLLVAFVCTLFAGCSIGIKGSGVSKTESREVADFEGVNASGVASVTITVGLPKSVSVTVDDNLMEYVETTVKDNKLSISTTKSINTSLGLNVEITVPTLNEATVSGVGDIRIVDAASETLKLKVSGVGNIEATGSVTNVDVSVSGVGDADLVELKAENVVVSVSGTGDANVFASKSVDAKVSGVGDIIVYGNPEVRKHNESGVGDVEFK
jgi:Putative auto-transporter adhesin, head GIN domain